MPEASRLGLCITAMGGAAAHLRGRGPARVHYIHHLHTTSNQHYVPPLTKVVTEVAPGRIQFTKLVAAAMALRRLATPQRST